MRLSPQIYTSSAARSEEEQMKRVGNPRYAGGVGLYRHAGRLANRRRTPFLLPREAGNLAGRSDADHRIGRGLKAPSGRSAFRAGQRRIEARFSNDAKPHVCGKMRLWRPTLQTI